jgi:hypothetical protein
MMRLTKYYGSEIRIVAGHGMTAVIHSRMNDIAKDLNYMPIEMGELMEDNPKIIFETTAEQVQNIPDELDNLIVPSGVAIQLAGILIEVHLSITLRMSSRLILHSWLIRCRAKRR